MPSQVQKLWIIINISFWVTIFTRYLPINTSKMGWWLQPVLVLGVMAFAANVMALLWLMLVKWQRRDLPMPAWPWWVFICLSTAFQALYWLL